MKAISLKQPWADFICLGSKTIETRKWKTNYRGDILICSSLKIDQNYLKKIKFEETKLVFEKLKSIYKKNAGIMVCIAELYHIEKMEKKHEKEAKCKLYEGAYAWYLRNIREVENIPVKGKLSLFEVDNNLIHII